VYNDDAVIKSMHWTVCAVIVMQKVTHQSFGTHLRHSEFLVHVALDA